MDRLKTTLSQICKGILAILGIPGADEAITTLFRTRKQGFSQIKQGILYLADLTEPQKRKRYIKSLLVDVPEHRQDIYFTILNNAFSYMDHNLNNSATISGLSKIMVPLTKRVLDKISIWDFVGVQPMRGPTGLIYRLLYENPDDQTQQSNQIKSLSIVSTAIEVCSRNLAAKYHPLENIQASSFTHRYAEAVIDVFSSAIAFEIDCNIVRTLINITPSAKPCHNNLIIKIMKMANTIQTNTKRGAGNFVILSPQSLEKLQEDADTNRLITWLPRENQDLNLAFPKLGEFKTGNCSIYLAKFPFSNDFDILVGYKGTPGEIDCGLIYSPYTLIGTYGAIVDPNTFNLVVHMYTRERINFRSESTNYYLKYKLEDDVESNPEIVENNETVTIEEELK